MFTSLAKKYDKPNALNVIFESRVKKIDKNDYFALTSLFLEVFNPSRAGQAEKLLSRYKVSRTQPGAILCHHESNVFDYIDNNAGERSRNVR